MATQTARETTKGQFRDLVTAVIEGIDLDIPRSQVELLLGNKGHLHELMRILLNSRPEAITPTQLRELVASHLPFGDEELTDSTYGYPVGFPRKTWQERLEIIQRNYADLKCEGLEKFITSLRERGVDEWVDDVFSPFIIPDPLAVAPTYAEAVVLAWSKLAQSPTYKGHIFNYREGELTSDRLSLVDEALYRQLEREWGCTLHGIPTVTAHTRLREMGGGCQLWPIFGQTGLRHRGRSVRRGHVMYTETEWGLGPFEILCILLTDGADRLTAFEHLSMDMPGAFYRSAAGGELESALCVYFYDVLLYLLDYSFSDPSQGFGAPSASLR